MSYFQIKKFSGIAPALSNRLLNEQFAQDAQNVDFTSGKLKPVRTDVEVTSSTQSSSHVVIEGIYPYEYTATAIAAASFQGILQSNVSSTFSAYHFASNKGWHGYYGMWSTGTGTFSNPQFDISQIYAVSSAGYYAGSGFVGLVVTVEDLTRTTPFEKTHLGTSSSLKITTGNYDGEEVVQLYVKDEFGSVTRPVKELKGFRKLLLKKGERKTVEFELSTDDLRFYNIDMKFVAEPGDFEVSVGGSSDANLKDKFVLVK